MDITKSGDKVVKLEQVSARQFRFVKADNSSYLLNIIDCTHKDAFETVNSYELVCPDEDNGKVGLEYEGVEYLVPGYTSQSVRIKKIDVYPTNNLNSDVYKLDITFENTNLNQEITIHIIFSK